MWTADLQACAQRLRDAAKSTDNATLRHFLEARAASFLSNDYYESDVAWMDLDAPLDVTVGPYETYNDELFGYKAAFESYVNLRDDAETAKLNFFGNHMQEVENNLPIDAKYRNPKNRRAFADTRGQRNLRGRSTATHGVQTAAYNLPNDDRVVHEKGSKRVMLRNVQEAKFNSTLTPISKVGAHFGGAAFGQLRRVFYAHPRARDEPWDWAASDHGERARDESAPGTERALQRESKKQRRTCLASICCSCSSTAAI